MRSASARGSAMAGTSMTGAKARRMATYGRMAGVALLVAATGLWALEIPGMKELPATPPAPQANEQPKPETQVKVAAVDPEIVVATAERLDIGRVKAEVPEVSG